jgi:hypothetical protein
VRVWLERVGLRSPEQQNESARLLGPWRVSRGESYRGTAIERRWHVGQHGKRRYLSSLPSATSMSAFAPIAAVQRTSGHFAFVPRADMRGSNFAPDESVAPGAMQAALSKHLSKRANGMRRRGRSVNHPQHNRVRTKLGLSDPLVRA